MSEKLMIFLKYKYLLYYKEPCQKNQICFMSKNTLSEKTKHGLGLLLLILVLASKPSLTTYKKRPREQKIFFA